MATLICKINLGLKNQTVFIRSEKYSHKETMEEYQMPFEDIASFIAGAQDVEEAVFSGPREYAKKIEQETKEKEKARYSKIKTKFVYI